MSEKIKVGPHVFDIFYLSKVVHEDGSEVLGQCDSVFNKIEILDSLPTTKKAQVEIHEVMHALVAQTGVLPSEDQEEMVVTALAVVLTQFAQDNSYWLKSWVNRAQIL